MPFSDDKPPAPSTGMLPEVPIDELVEWLGRCQIVSVAGVLPVRRRCVMLARQAGAVIGESGGRQLPSETFRFAPSRRSSLRSCRVLATSVARPGASRSAFAPPIHMAMGGHGFREGTSCRLTRR